MNTAFDDTAHQYDHEFSWSPIGLIQRKMVWNFLEKELRTELSASILELNCGTGEDAVWLALNHQQILATDISGEMIKIAQQKACLQKVNNQIRFKVMDIQDAKVHLAGEKFDLVFSNFGGFNCLSDDQFSHWLNGQLPDLLNPGGRFVAVLMSKFCVWESLYFLSKFQFRKAFRRLSKGPVEGKLSAVSSINTWYYAPQWIKTHLPETLTVSDVKAIGLFIPPSYLNHFFATHIKLFSTLQKLENSIKEVKAAALFSDHYLIEIQLKPL